MALRADEIISVLEKQFGEVKATVQAHEVGTVLEVGDGIARVYGLSTAMAGEMIDFPEANVKGVAFNLEESSVGVIILGDYLAIAEGHEARSTGELLRVPVGDAVIGRVIDPLGNPRDGKGAVLSTQTRPVEVIAPGVAERQPVEEALQTGIKAIDSMTPVGRGQRELIIGDRKTGKTAIAIDTIINQKGKDVICVYVAIGQKESTVAKVVQTLQEKGAMDYTVVVTAASSDPAPLQYYAPYAGCAIAEYFMYEFGRATLCVYDDLSKQAAAYRQLSLLMRRPPGREAYPGDIFYAHSRLLERSCKLANHYVIVARDVKDEDVKADWGVNSKADPKRPRKSGEPGMVYVGPGELGGLHQAQHKNKDTKAIEGDITHFPDHKVVQVPRTGGSLTALPIIETLEGEVSAYIPTNVISITDGQIYLQPDLFNAGVRPAVDVGISVSRVGGKAQIPAMKQVAGSLRLDLASFRELEAFAQLGTDLDAATQKQLDRGYRMVEILKQVEGRPMDVIDQVMIIFAGTRGFLDKVPRSEVANWQDQFLRYMHEQGRDVLAKLTKAREFDGKPIDEGEIGRGLIAAITAFAGQFKPSRPSEGITASREQIKK